MLLLLEYGMETQLFHKQRSNTQTWVNALQAQDVSATAVVGSTTVRQANWSAVCAMQLVYLSSCSAGLPQSNA